MVYEIKIYGNESLRTLAEPVVEIDAEILQILEDMVETMHEANGVGLAAPQVGINKRLFVIDIGDGIIRKVINPEIIELSDVIESNEEGCLSVPGIYKPVKRSVHIKIKYTNENGKEVVEEADDLLGRAFQHEYDHLEAILFIDKISPVAKRMVTKKLQLLKKESTKI
ncbi:peptide deformylase [uncultured Cetobacterium sp.]|uniref:peptide deformylase n=1 Tax=uncultured Cetobacterium sp. TaxID=527638 RepID=UPI00262F6140|nr:peptide deformylase [uncultured Cetobacterium sp.]